MNTELTREYIAELRSIIEVKDDNAALEKLEALHPADIAEIYEESLHGGSHLPVPPAGSRKGL